MNIGRLFNQSAQVETLSSSTTYGGKYASPVTRMVFVNDGHERKQSTDGVEIVSQTTLYDAIDAFDLYRPGSKVTVNGRTAHVVTAYKRDSAGPVPAHHTQVNLA